MSIPPEPDKHPDQGGDEHDQDASDDEVRAEQEGLKGPKPGAVIAGTVGERDRTELSLLEIVKDSRVESTSEHEEAIAVDIDTEPVSEG